MSGDSEYFAWLINWCAALVQKPGRHAMTAIVLRGGQGVGKGHFANLMLGALFHPQQYLHIMGASQLTAEFNEHLSGKVLIFADESTWGGDPKAGAKLGSPDIKVGRSPGRSDQELCDLGRNRLIHGFFWDLPEQYFLASVDGRLRRPRSGWGACSAAAKSRRKVFNLWLLLDDRWAGDTAQVVPVR